MEMCEEALSHVIEECGEVLFWAGKVQRFGWHSSHPKYNNEPNIRGLSRELNDLKRRIRELENTIRVTALDEPLDNN